MSDVLKLGEIVTIARGTTYSGKLVGEPGAKLLGLGSILRDGGYKGQAVKSYGGLVPSEIEVQEGELYASLKDVTQTADVLGAVARLPKGEGIGRLTQDTVRLDIVSGSGVESEYIYWMLRTPQYRQYCRAHATGTTTMGLSRRDFLNFEIPVPDDSRSAIVELLGALDDKIAANKRLSGAVQDLLQERFALLRLDGFTGDGSFLTVSDLFEVNPRTSQKLAGQAPYLGMKDLPDSSLTVGSWSTREAKSGARFINGDVLLARITPCLENGKVGYVDFLEHAEVGVGSTEFIVFRARSSLLSAVPFFLAKSERFRDFAIKHMQGTSGRQRLAATDVADYRLAKVDDESLNRFGELSLNLLKRVKTGVSESRALARTRDELLPLLMSGKITVKDAEAVVSDAV